MGDASGTTSSQPLRAVSLIASATEIVHALGMGDAQVGRSHECDWPPGVLDLPQLTKAKFKVAGGSAAIDKAVRDLVTNALAVYEVNADGLSALAPDIILTQDQCVVCAVSLSDVERAVCETTGLEAKVVSLKPHSMADVYRDIQKVADAFQQPQRGQTLVADMQRRLDRVEKLTKDRYQPRVAFIEWMDPLMSCGHWMPELVSLAGGTSLFGEQGATSPYITWQQLAESDPDIIVIAPCGYEIFETENEIDLLTKNPVWQGLRAVVDGKVFVADGNAYFNRPGPRLVETAEILSEILHQEICDFGHLEQAYKPLPSVGGA